MTAESKGRVERLFRTLQDRLVIEVRLAQVRTCEQANQVLQAYLPKFNQQFAVPAAQPEVAYRPVQAGMKLEEVCCFHYERVVGLDNTVQFGSNRLQVQADATRKSYARAVVQVHERLDGSLALLYAGRQLGWRDAPLEAPQLRARGRRASRTPQQIVDPAEQGAEGEATHGKQAAVHPSLATSAGSQNDIFTEHLIRHFHWTPTQVEAAS